MKSVRVTTVTRRTVTLTVRADDTEIEVDLDHEPYDTDEVLCHLQGDQLVVAYLVHDDDAQGMDPFDGGGDCNGDLYRRGDRCNKRDHGEFLDALGLDSYGVNADQRLSLNGEPLKTLDELAEAEILDRLRSEGLLNDDTDLDEYSNEREVRINRLYREHWKQIVGPYVIPVSYSDDRGETFASIDNWDGDPDELPDAVWVACRCAIENIDTTAYRMFDGGPISITWEYNGHEKQQAVVRHQGDYEVGFDTWADAVAYCNTTFGPPGLGHLREAAMGYLKPTLEEHVEWANGEVFGCVVHTFQRQEDGAWERSDESRHENSCWGYIGLDYAREALKDEFFNPAVNELTASQKESPSEV